VFAAEQMPTKKYKTMTIGLVIQKPQSQLSDVSNEYDLICASVNQAVTELKKTSNLKNIEIQVQKFEYEKDEISIIPAIHQALKSDIIAILGASPSPFALLAAKEIKGKEIVLIPPLAVANALSAEFPNVLMMSHRADTGALMSAVILDSVLNSKKFLAPVAWERTASRNSWEGLPENIRNRGEVFKIFESNPDLVAFRKKLNSEKYDAIFSPNFPGVTAQLIRSASADGHNIPFVGNAAWGENIGGSLHQMTKELKFRGVFSREFSIWTPLQKLNSFRDMIETKTKDPFSSTAVLYYDATLFLGNEILKCGVDCDRKNLQNSIAKNPYFKGIFGEYKFDKRSTNKDDAIYNLIEVNGLGFKYLGKMSSKGLLQK
jgi:hypothetical protein